MSPKNTQKEIQKYEPWDFPVRYLKGVGDNLARLFASADIVSLWDLLLFLPRTYEDRRKIWTYEEMLATHATSPLVISVGQILSVSKKGAGFGGKSWLEATVQVWGAKNPGQNLLHFVWFKDWGGAIEKKFPEGSRVLFRGKIQEFRGRLQISHPELQMLDKEVPWWEKNPWVPVYKEIGGLSTKQIRKIMALALEREEFLKIPEILPLDLVKKYGFSTLRESLRELHFPKNWEPKTEQPRPEGPFYARIVFEELFHMALALHIRRAHLKEMSRGKNHRAPKIDLAPAELKALQEKLPFALTLGQKNVLGEILADLSCTKDFTPMHRMLQGDVGSGKTIVAFLAVLAAMQSGCQSALMAPTEILANQHHSNFCKLFPQHSHRVALLKGALKAKEKKTIREKIQSGEILFAIGTQALLTDDTDFNHLGLVIVDEQHRFGVEQRLNLKHGNKTLMPHLLVMTATPIPRSLALTLYGDLNMSFLKEKPVGRKPIETHLVKNKAHLQLQERLKVFLNEGRQIYIVYPLVEESEKLDLKNATASYAEWQKIFGAKGVGLLHGKMKPKEKEEIMQQFKKGDLRVLVSTTVIEVGVDVPNASVMVIEHAERFGLSQLHQLRGRVGRGSLNSFCILMSPDSPSDAVYERLKLLEKTEDGFEIAEKDLEIRGPGEFLGRRQSGMQGFRVAHILRDQKWLEIARNEAREILNADPSLRSPENQELKAGLERWWLSKLELTLSG